MKSVQNYLKEHPSIATAVRWGVPITVGITSAGIIFYAHNRAVIEAKEPELDKCTSEALASANNVMNNCTNFAVDYACSILKKGEVLVDICGETIHQTSMFSFPYNCSLKNGADVLLKCINVVGYKDSKFWPFYVFGAVGSIISGGAVGAAEGFIQKKLLEPGDKVTDPGYRQLQAEEQVVRQ